MPVAAVVLAGCGQAPRDDASGGAIANAARSAEAAIGAYRPDPTASRTAAGRASRSPERPVTVPGATPSTPAYVPPALVIATYDCADGSRIDVRYDNGADVAVLDVNGRRLTLKGQRPASGLWYAADGWNWRGKGREATLSVADKPPLACTARD